MLSPMALIPPDLCQALQHANLAAYFNDCTASHRREYLQWIEAAKRPATRAVRVSKTVAMLAERQAAEAARSAPSAGSRPPS